MSKRLEPWEECPEVWATQAQYFQWMRGQMRKAWSRHAVKNKFVKLNTFTAPIGRIVKKTGKPMMIQAGKCACCGETFKKALLQVDHIHGAGSFRGWDDFEQWMRGLMHVCVADLQFMCKPCHETKTYADTHGLSFEDARLEKIVIVFKNCKATRQKLILHKLGIEPAVNDTLRVQQYREYINDRETN
jgi:hypothetical protein